MRLIINADDLGATEAINDAIFELMGEGLVSSATTMANAPALEHALQRIPQYPRCSFGVHLNITAFAPLRPDKALEPLLDESGCLTRKVEKRRLSPATLRAIYAEFCAQIERLQKAGVAVSHFDSHHHAHHLPALFPVIKAVQRRFGLRKVRASLDIYPAETLVPAARRFKKNLFNFCLRRLYATRTADHFGPFIDFYARLEEAPAWQNQTLELMVHPGAKTPLYVEEVRLLRSAWRDRLPAPPEIISYHEL
jgi:predicted glycoside hydrolase/deacetylase ChbG (UPF0249 family)